MSHKLRRLSDLAATEPLRERRRVAPPKRPEHDLLNDLLERLASLREDARRVRNTAREERERSRELAAMLNRTAHLPRG